MEHLKGTDITQAIHLCWTVFGIASVVVVALFRWARG